MNLVERYYYSKAQELIKQEIFFIDYISSCGALTDLERDWVIKTYFGMDELYPPNVKRRYSAWEHAEGSAYRNDYIAEEVLPAGSHADYFD